LSVPATSSAGRCQTSPNRKRRCPPVWFPRTPSLWSHSCRIWRSSGGCRTPFTTMQSRGSATSSAGGRGIAVDFGPRMRARDR
jgi:hypothetical protein